LTEHNGVVVYALREIAARVENAGVAKAGLATVLTLVLGDAR